MRNKKRKRKKKTTTAGIVFGTHSHRYGLSAHGIFLFFFILLAYLLAFSHGARREL